MGVGPSQRAGDPRRRHGRDQERRPLPGHPKSCRGRLMRERIDYELSILRDGGQAADYFDVGGRGFVLYREVPTRSPPPGPPAASDVIVPVPSGYPAAMIDLAGLPVDSPLLGRVKGGG